MKNNKTIDRYDEVTNKIIEALENNTRPWVKPWDGGILSLPMRHNGDTYQGINSLILWSQAAEHQYYSAYWMTFNQAKLLGGNVRKREKSTVIFYSGTIKNNKEEENNTEKEKKEKQETDIIEPQYIKFMKSYGVFNADQIDNLPEKYYVKDKEVKQNTDLKKLPQLEIFIKNTEAKINFAGIRAYYQEQDDYIQIPEIGLFKNSNAYYATLSHELTHWTKHKTRLNRDLGAKYFGDAGYAMEELVAELGAAFLSVNLGIVPDIREDHAPYIKI